MKKFCVFCGLLPENKNKEHIIPKWLMKLTGTDEKKMSVGSDWNTGKEIEINFLAFSFPSCKKCNDEFASIESRVKPIIEKILKDEYVQAEELILLLDWFDKVRISLWLAIKYRNSSTITLEPKYYIKDRVRLKDRLLAITNCYDNYEGLRWTGVNSYYFLMSPTCFTMKINNVLFTNCSMDFIVSEKLGFPYPAFERQNPNNEKLTDILLLDGSQKIEHLTFMSNLYPPYIMISQPIYKVNKMNSPTKYQNEFVKLNSIDFDKGEGKIFISRNNITSAMDINEEVSFRGDLKKKTFKFNKPTSDFQFEILNSRKIIFNSAEEEQQHHRALSAMKEIAELQLKKYDY